MFSADVCCIAYYILHEMSCPCHLQVCVCYVEGQDTVFLAPTGFGKSIVYQLAPLLVMDTQNPQFLIVMPLTALINDSIARLKVCCVLSRG